MRKKVPVPEICPLVKEWMPEATDDDLKSATVRLRGYLAVVHRIFQRLESESTLPEVRDKCSLGDRVSNDN
jgi:hypothetical protein